VPVWLLIGVVALVTIVVAAVALIYLARSGQTSGAGTTVDERRPEGYWMGSGMAIGMGIGIPLGLVMDNLALGIAMGAGMGVAIGAGLEQKYKANLRPLTDAELRARRWAVGLGLAVLALGVAVFVVLFFVTRR
jgi:hypothetical protein